MDAIRTYLENMFMSLPDTPETRRAKEELLMMMEDKYYELKEMGKTENEAVGIVISEFGNLEELAEELGISGYMGRESEERERLLSLEEAQDYIRGKTAGAAKVAAGVLLCIWSPIALILLGNFSKNSRFGISESVAEITGLTVMFVMVALAVSIFIYQGMKSKEHEWLEKGTVALDAQAKEYAEEEKKAFHTTFTVCIILGVALCILGVLPAVVLDELLGGVFRDIGGGILLLIVGVAVFLMVFAGIKYYSYEQILKEGEYEPKKEEGESSHVFRKVFWNLVTAVYLLWSFLTMDWDRTWILWPIAAILYGVGETICKAVFGDRQKNGNEL